MELLYIEEHTSCGNYVSDNNSGFKLITPLKGDMITHKDISSSHIVFLLEGELEISCNEFTNRLFKKGTMIFLPQSSDVYLRAITACKVVVHVLDSRTTNLCDKQTLNQYARSCAEVDYDFKGLKFRRPLTEFLDLLTIYLAAKVNCAHLHEIKQKELFIVFRTAYMKEELVEFFYPILGFDIDFRARVLEAYGMGASIEELAKTLSMHEKTFTSKFSKEFGISYHQWVLKQKAKHIQHKLALPHTKIKDMIREFGFSDSSHFNRFCKKQFNCTPTELLGQMRGKTTVK